MSTLDKKNINWAPIEYFYHVITYIEVISLIKEKIELSYFHIKYSEVNIKG